MTKNLITKEVLSEIKKRNQTAKSISDNNLQFALSNEDFKANYNKYKFLVFEISKEEFNGNNVNELKLELNEIVNKLKANVSMLNFTFNDFKPQFYCKVCNDTGFIKGKHCVCFKELMSQKLIGFSGKNNISDLASFNDANFDIYDEDIKNEMKVLFEKLKDYSSSFNTKTKKIITLHGQTGVGKTFVAECVVRNAIENGFFTVYTTAINLNSQLLKYHLADLREKNSIMSNFIECDILVIDDLGTEPMLKNVTEEYLYHIISERLNKKLSTIITTNLTLEQIQDSYGDRIFSRLTHSRDAWLAEITGKDLRQVI